MIATDGKELVQVSQATVRFAGDSGDGMQLVGGQFADIASMTGSAICSFPDFPSDIRAPAGTLGGVSGYQLSFGDERVTTPGDAPFDIRTHQILEHQTGVKFSNRSFPFAELLSQNVPPSKGCRCLRCPRSRPER